MVLSGDLIDYDTCRQDLGTPYIVSRFYISANGSPNYFHDIYSLFCMPVEMPLPWDNECIRQAGLAIGKRQMLQALFKSNIINDSINKLNYLEISSVVTSTTVIALILIPKLCSNLGNLGASSLSYPHAEIAWGPFASMFQPTDITTWYSPLQIV